MLDHPFLPSLFAEFEASHYSCLVIEYCPGGDLLTVSQRQRRLRFYAAEVLLTLEYLHAMGITYRDLKPENVIVQEKGYIMLSDFDLFFKCDVVLKLLMQRSTELKAMDKSVIRKVDVQMFDEKNFGPNQLMLVQVHLLGLTSTRLRK
ncbi:hypothetical protein KPL71_020825 [Citrus sinensis]|uniref:Uncharacterized protein n=1 Tax=Citrus sinensis TaxID=2711 RepID=A0ACB8JAT7_CITSI|nr:hypothetical protein KPL71_020825 [Citrus sinensis]